MDFDKCLFNFFFILFSMSPKLAVSDEPPSIEPIPPMIIPTPLSRPSKDCYNVYSTEITVHKGLRITLHCPSCTQEWKDLRYQWEILVDCPDKVSRVCWGPIGQNESKWTFTVDTQHTAHCIVSGTNGAQKINQTSGNIKLRVEDVSEYEYCEGLVSSGRVTLLVAVITSVIIIIITLSIGIYFLCKKRLASVAPAPGRGGGGGNCLNTHHRGSNPYAEEFTEDGYLRPNGVGLIREQSYLEILSDHDMRRSNVSSCTSDNGQPQSLNYYENIESVRNRQ